jgi:hypothetical protein
VSKPDWAKIRAEYITGGISQRKLAAKYGVSETTLMKKAAAENWSKLKKETDSKSTAKAQQKKIAVTASNAVKLEQVKGLLIDRLRKAIESMPDNGGTHSRQYISKGDKKLTVDYSLLDMVAALEKLAKDDDSKSGDPVTIVWGR